MHDPFLLGLGSKEDACQILWLITEVVREQPAGDGLLVIGAQFIRVVTAEGK
jgi:hypothetical protein